MKKVFLLYHIYEYDEEDEVNVLGIYKTKDAAKAAISLLKEKRGFSKYPNGFHIKSYKLNKTKCKNGFIPNIEMPVPVMDHEDRELVSKLTNNEIQLIDKALLSHANNNWRKVAMIVGLTMSETECNNGIPDLFYAERIRKLVDEGYLESEGDLRFMGHSEVRKINCDK